jgi:DNA recombination protein RmuC
MADDVLRLAGFIDGVNYRRRQVIAGSGGIPDYTFLLPQGLSLHMDVKFPLNNYLRYLDATSDVERERWRKEFLKDVRLRLKEVTSRDYVDVAANTVDCVLLFIPNESVYAFIQEQDRTILDDALRDKVVFCSPLTLFAVLAVIRQAVDNFRLSQTTQEILALLQGFQKQWGKFVDQMDKVGRSMKTAASAFEELEGTRKRGLERELDKIDAVRRQQQLDTADEADGTVTRLALEA